MKTDTRRSPEENAIMDKINRMITETGEHPFVFKSEGVPVFVSFPIEASDYFTKAELVVAKHLVMNSEKLQHEEKSVQQKEGGLSQRLMNAKNAALGQSQNFEINKRKQDRSI